MDIKTQKNYYSILFISLECNSRYFKALGWENNDEEFITFFKIFIYPYG